MKFKPTIITGICKCGHKWVDHHLGMIINKEVYDSLPEGYPPYVPQEWEYYGFNEWGGFDDEGNDHCHGYKDDPEPCKFGCLFKCGQLEGDCRMPESDACLMKKIK